MKTPLLLTLILFLASETTQSNRYKERTNNNYRDSRRTSSDPTPGELAEDFAYYCGLNKDHRHYGTMIDLSKKYFKRYDRTKTDAIKKYAEFCNTRKLFALLCAKMVMAYNTKGWQMEDLPRLLKDYRRMHFFDLNRKDFKSFPLTYKQYNEYDPIMNMQTCLEHLFGYSDVPEFEDYMRLYEKYKKERRIKNKVLCTCAELLYIAVITKSRKELKATEVFIVYCFENKEKTLNWTLEQMEALHNYNLTLEDNRKVLTTKFTRRVIDFMITGEALQASGWPSVPSIFPGNNWNFSFILETTFKLGCTYDKKYTGCIDTEVLELAIYAMKAGFNTTDFDTFFHYTNINKTNFTSSNCKRKILDNVFFNGRYDDKYHINNMNYWKNRDRFHFNHFLSDVMPIVRVARETNCDNFARDLDRLVGIFYFSLWKEKTMNNMLRKAKLSKRPLNDVIDCIELSETMEYVALAHDLISFEHTHDSEDESDNEYEEYDDETFTDKRKIASDSTLESTMADQSSNKPSTVVKKPAKDYDSSKEQYYQLIQMPARPPPQAAYVERLFNDLIKRTDDRECKEMKAIFSSERTILKMLRKHKFGSKIFI